MAASALDYGEDAGVLLNSVTYTVSVPYLIQGHCITLIGSHTLLVRCNLWCVALTTGVPEIAFGNY